MSKEDDTDLPEKWLIRPCHIYYEEFDDCTSVKARFNQYFIYGEPIDCTQWKIDYDNCTAWVKNKQDLEAYNNLLKSEKARRIKRLRPHVQNDVWEKRETPPEDWNKPLPEFLAKRYENSYLSLKSAEMKNNISPSTSSCTIL